VTEPGGRKTKDGAVQGDEENFSCFLFQALKDRDYEANPRKSRARNTKEMSEISQRPLGEKFHQKAR
jgi:hypothetical protein